MKNIITLLFILLISQSFSQSKNDTIWYTSTWERTKDNNLKTYYKIKEDDKSGRGMATYFKKDGTV